MSIKTGRNQEPYRAYVKDGLIDFYEPKTLFYTTRSALECRRFHCGTCGELHAANGCRSVRAVEWVTGTTMPDALYRAREAMMIDEKLQEMYDSRNSNGN